MPNLGPGAFKDAAGNPMLTPQQQMALQQALMNPDGQDEFVNPMMPAGPEGLVAGGLGGIAISTAFDQYFKGGADSWLVRSAKTLDGLPGVNWLSGVLENEVFSKLRGSGSAWHQQLATHMAPDAVEKHLLQHNIQALEKHMPANVYQIIKDLGTHQEAEKLLPNLIKVAQAQRTWTERLFGWIPLVGRFAEAKPNGLSTVLETLHANIGNQITPSAMAAQVSALEAKLPAGGLKVLESAAKDAILQQMTPHLSPAALESLTSQAAGVAEDAFGKNLVQHLTAAFEKEALHGEITKLGQGIPATVAKALHGLENVTAVQSMLPKMAEVAKAPPKGISKLLDGLFRRTRGLENFYMHTYREQHALMEHLGPGVGPVGRIYAGMMNYMRRMFGGDTLTTGFAKGGHAAGETKSLMGKLFGPFLSGGLVIGFALGEAKKAEGPGEKVKAFFHNLLGTGIGMLMGMEIGRKLINGSGIILRLMPKLGQRILFTLPLLGKVTWGGFITEMLAMFVLSVPFQRAGEWISNRIFGKPKHIREEELKRQGIYPAKPLPPSKDPAQHAVARDQGGFQKFRDQRQRLSQEADKKPNEKSEPHQKHPEEKVDFGISAQEIMKNRIAETQDEYYHQLVSKTVDEKTDNPFDPSWLGGGH